MYVTVKSTLLSDITVSVETHCNETLKITSSAWSSLLLVLTLTFDIFTQNFFWFISINDIEIVRYFTDFRPKTAILGQKI